MRPDPKVALHPVPAADPGRWRWSWWRWLRRHIQPVPPAPKLLDALRLSLRINQFAVANLDGTPGWPMKAELLALADLLLDPTIELDPFTRELGYAFRGFAKSNGPEPLSPEERGVIPCDTKSPLNNVGS